MDFAPTSARRRTGENIVPMINVVFLLLIFFLMSAQIAPQDPFEVSPPSSTSDTAHSDPDTLYISAEGVLSYLGQTGDAAFAALRERASDDPLALRADSALSASSLVALLPRLAEAGITDTRLVTGMQR